MGDQSRHHHPRCYQSTQIPDDLPVELCDCRVLRMIEVHTPPAPACDCDYWDSKHRFHCATNFPLAPPTQDGA